MKDYPSPVTKQCHETISYQMNNLFYLINGKDIGIFIHIKHEDKDIYALLINKYIKNEEFKDTIKINNEKKIIKLEDIMYKNKEDNISIIKLKQKYNEINYIEIDDKLFEEEMYYINESIYIIHYNDINDILISYGVLKEINKDELILIGNINSEYKFSPIFNLSNNKLIGIHNNINNKKYFTKGILLKRYINELIKRVKCPNKIQYKYNDKCNENINEVNMLIKIEKEDINKQIYFLDNGYKKKNFLYIKHYAHDNLKELNKYNTKLYINKKQYEYNKYFIPEKEGKYEIIIKFKINLVDCSCMFAGCEKY